MPTLIIKRHSSQSTEFDIPISDLRWGNVVTLFRGQTEKSITLDQSTIDRAKEKLDELVTKNVIQYLVTDSADPDDKVVLGGLKPSVPTNASTIAAFRLNVTEGSARVHNLTANLAAQVDLDCIANGVDKAGAAAALIAADGYSRKARVFLVNTVFDGSGSWAIKLVYGDEALDAAVGTVEDTSKGYPTDTEVAAAMDYKNWELYVEVGYVKFARAGGAITQTYQYLGAPEAKVVGFVQKFTQTYGFADFASDAALTKDVDISKLIPAGCVLLGVAPELDAAFTSTGAMTSLKVSVGISTDKDELMEQVELLSGPPTVGILDAKPTVPELIGAARAKYAGLVNFTAVGVNLDTLDAGSVHLHFFYIDINLVTQPV